MINKAYIKNNFENVTVISGINFYPFKIDMTFYMNKFAMEESAIMLPMCLCLGMPVYMYRLVLEKEQRLTETMKINGLILHNYWIVNFLFNYLYYMITAIIYMLAGTFVFRIPVFLKTNTLIFLLITNGWGLAQVSFAFLMSVFIQKSSTASIVGYGLSIYLMIMA